MNSFKLTAVGNLARNPELISKGDKIYTRLLIVGSDYIGRDEEGTARETVSTMWFTAFGVLGDVLAKHTRKGDQLILEARVESNNWLDGHGEKRYDHDFIVIGFRFGTPGAATREAFRPVEGGNG